MSRIDPDDRSSIVQLALGYQASLALFVATKFGIPDLLAPGRMNIDDIAAQVGANPDAILRLMRALSAFDVFTDLGGNFFELTRSGQHLRSDFPRSIRPLVLMYGSEHSRQMFSSLGRCVLTGSNAFKIQFGVTSSFEYLHGHPELAKTFDDGMSAVSQLTGPALAASYDFSGARTVVDIGGGHGIVLASILRQNPHLRGTLYDLPRVIDGAAPVLAREGVAERCLAVGGDMFSSVPDGGDLYLLSHVIHNWNNEKALRILGSCRRAISDHGKVLLVDRVIPEMIEPDKESKGATLIDLMMMVRTCGGRERTAIEFQSLLAESGLTLTQIIPLHGAEWLIEATPN